MRIDGGCFLVSGGASGLGAATLWRLVERGGKVVSIDVNAELSAAMAAELGPNVRFVGGDVTSESDVRSAIDVALREFGPLNGAVACAGIELAERVVGKTGVHSLDAFSRVIGVNLIGTFNVVRLSAEAMANSTPNAEGERGVIVCTASVAAYEGQIGQAAYAASKGGVAAMTLPLARDLARQGIRVMTIAPGVFDTPLMARFPESVRQQLEQQVPFPPRFGHPAEFAALVEHIFENTMLNGEVIRLDGALRMPPK